MSRKTHSLNEYLDAGKLLKCELPNDALLKSFCSRCLSNNILASSFGLNEYISTHEKDGKVVGIIVVGDLATKTILLSFRKSIRCKDCWKDRVSGRYLRLFGSAFFYTLLRPKKPENTSEIIWLATKFEYQRSGIGATLVKEACDYVVSNRGCDVYVKTLESTPGNIVFYCRNGFRVVDSRLGRIGMLRKNEQ